MGRIERILRRIDQSVALGSVRLAFRFEHSAFVLEANLPAPHGERGICFGPSDEDHVFVHEQRIVDLEIFEDGNIALIAVAIPGLQLLGYVAIGSGFARGPIDDHGGSEPTPDVARKIRGPVARIGNFVLNSGGFEEGLRRDGLGGVGGEVAVHQFQKSVVAELAAQRIEEERTGAFLKLETSLRRFRRKFQAAVANFFSINRLFDVRRLQQIVVGGRSGDKPRVGIGDGKNPALPELFWVLTPGNRLGFPGSLRGVFRV